MIRFAGIIIGIGTIFLISSSSFSQKKFSLSNVSAEMSFEQVLKRFPDSTLSFHLKDPKYWFEKGALFRYWGSMKKQKPIVFLGKNYSLEKGLQKVKPRMIGREGELRARFPDSQEFLGASEIMWSWRGNRTTGFIVRWKKTSCQSVLQTLKKRGHKFLRKKSDKSFVIYSFSLKKQKPKVQLKCQKDEIHTLQVGRV